MHRICGQLCWQSENWRPDKQLLCIRGLHTLGKLICCRNVKLNRYNTWARQAVVHPVAMGEAGNKKPAPGGFFVCLQIQAWAYKHFSGASLTRTPNEACRFSRKLPGKLPGQCAACMARWRRSRPPTYLATRTVQLASAARIGPRCPPPARPAGACNGLAASQPSANCPVSTDPSSNPGAHLLVRRRGANYPYRKPSRRTRERCSKDTKCVTVALVRATTFPRGLLFLTEDTEDTEDIQ